MAEELGAESGRATYPCEYCGRRWRTLERAANCHPGGQAAAATQSADELRATVEDLTGQLAAALEHAAALQVIADTAQAQVEASETDRASLWQAVEELQARVAALETAGDDGSTVHD